MIQEPQQPEIFEIPLVNSMSITENSSSKNQLLNPNNSQKNLNQNSNNKNQRTLIQIPQQNSKPRIFLLTRPSKPQLVRLETQTVQPHHQRNLNLSQHHHPQKTTATVTSQTQTKIIRIPFLPRSQVQTFSVKSNTNQVLKKDSKIVPQKTVQYQNQSQVQQYSDHTQVESTQVPIILQQVNTNQLSPTSVETESKQLQTKQESVKNTLVKSTVKNSSNLSENKNKIIQSQAQAQSKIPLTLASMAGIELTGADMSLSQADMSGAMPPTATVEEINVPVFIDEYLQEVTAASTLPVTTDNIFNNNTNKNNSSNISNNNHSNEKGNEVNNFLDTLENFEFDINLLTENNSKDKETALEVQVNQQHLQQPLQYPQQHQQSLTEVDEDNKFKQHQFELQMMLEDILFNNNNNNNNNINNTSNNNTTTTTTNNNNINNINEMAGSNNINDEIFAVAPHAIDDLELDDFDFSSTLDTHEHAVDLNINYGLSSEDIFNSSQPNEVMLTSCNSQSQSSQNLIKEIAKAEPYINSTPTPSYDEMCGVFEEDINMIFPSEYNDENNMTGFKETLLVNPLKRNSSQTSQHMLEKRRKLRLDTTACRENILSQQTEITTPKVIDIIDQFNDDTMGQTAVDSIITIYNDLISTSPKCDSVKSEIIVDEITNDFTPPNTPFSFNSISNQTSFVNTAPSSPASSIATISNASFTTKRGRGRPAKTHSDIPDRSQIQHLSESEQKKVLERAKNNEASRKSRLKHKERDNALEREEIELTLKNKELENQLMNLRKMEKKLKAALHFKVFGQ
ncbi:putative mediator of RNA polymerase II transcription subunit 26 [Lucilia sericata]|uniref:putative mediator of RNA polymerase II transcription subunit 26 n=1 Tax=Lucilia sericata TaxID=13632 RepID=UPI0018A865B0|nr:putative mediator of RNA polymerase II transcription subunit 26 [Lucilia sericata]XP_037822007.1 putative mediator of RNA polymerase II transcription subunit 26 [Lucilia sericata]